jgi:putative nucleotidyltransferase with HDIG domain
MASEILIKKVKQFVEEECKKPSAKYGVDAYNFHFIPVANYSKILASKVGADLDVVELSSWLHDIGSIIHGREDHHITSCEIAEKKLREFGCPEEIINKVKHCIFSHRGSKNITRETIEAEVLVDADSMSHFDDIGGLFKAAYVYEGMSHDEARESVKNKIINSFAKLSPSAKEIIRSKFEAAMLLLD